MTINMCSNPIAGNAPWVKHTIADPITLIDDLINLEGVGPLNVFSDFFAVEPFGSTPSFPTGAGIIGGAFLVMAVGGDATGTLSLSLGRTGIGTEDINEFAVQKNNTMVILQSTNSINRMRADNFSNGLMMIQFCAATGVLVPFPVPTPAPIVVDFEAMVKAFNASYVRGAPVGDTIQRVVGPDGP